MPTKVGELVSIKIDGKLVIAKITGEGVLHGEPVFFVRYGGAEFVKPKKVFDTKTEPTLQQLNRGGKY